MKHDEEAFALRSFNDQGQKLYFLGLELENGNSQRR